MEILFKKGSPGRTGASLPACDVPKRKTNQLIPDRFLRAKPARLPELSEPEVVRHFVSLSTLNHHVDKGFYPLGSCTMKYNPKINEETAALPGFRRLHPHQPASTVPGMLQLVEQLGQYLCEISGLAGITLQPAAGAHGELTGLMLIRAYHDNKGRKRKHILIPDSAHGTNPASAMIAGYETKTIKSNASGLIDIETLKRYVDNDTAALMLTNPNTLGLFETQVIPVIKMLHDVGALVYMDGANMNALLGRIRPGDLGVDVMHFNLHKTFSTPHGGGGPGSGPIGVSERLLDFLPQPCCRQQGKEWVFAPPSENSIGNVSTFLGNIAVMVKAYTYIRMLGDPGLKRISENAILNANYLLSLLRDEYDLPYTSTPMHEFVLSGNRQKQHGVKTLDIAKRLLDFGVHAPTVYFPLIVPEALMIEPTETETKESIESFASIMNEIAREARETPDRVQNAPYNTPVSRLDEAKAAKDLNINFFQHQDPASKTE
jgi:glycine dehydrogenase subunit 2